MLEKMLAFTRVIDLHGFAKAANDLHIATSVLTRRINQLEQALGVKLIQRSTRSLTITDAGQLFYQRAKAILHQTDSAINAVKTTSEQVNGSLKLGIPASINQLILLPAINEFMRLYPTLNLHITEGNHLISLLDKGFDCVIHCGNLPDSNFHYRKLGAWTKVTCASPAYFKTHAKPLTPDALIDHNCINHSDNRSQQWRYAIENETRAFRIGGNLQLNNSLALKNLSIQDLGIVNLPSFTVAEAIMNGQLETVLDDFTLPPLGIYAIYPSKQFLNAKTQAFLDFMTGRINDPES